MSARAGRAASASNRAMLWRMGLRRLRAPRPAVETGECGQPVLLLQRVDVGLALCCAIAHVRLLSRSFSEEMPAAPRAAK